MDSHKQISWQEDSVISALIRNSITRIKSPTKMAAAPDVDVTPIMNMFIILIPFLISMAVFSHLTVLQFSLPAEGGPGRAIEEKELPVTVALTSSEIAITRGEDILATVSQNEGSYDFTALVTALRAVVQNYSVAESIVVAIDDSVLFEDVVMCMDHCQEAGFKEIGLVSGTNLDRQASEGGDR